MFAGLAYFKWKRFFYIYVINSFLMKEEDVSRFAKKKTKKQGLIFGPFYQVAF
jgi:hypothetical protein